MKKSRIASPVPPRIVPASSAARRSARRQDPGFRRAKGYADMPMLVAALRARDRQLGLAVAQPVVKAGKYVRFRPADLLEYIDRRSRAHTVVVPAYGLTWLVQRAGMPRGTLRTLIACRPPNAPSPTGAIGSTLLRSRREQA
jgi:hypothetical protein